MKILKIGLISVCALGLILGVYKFNDDKVEAQDKTEIYKNFGKFIQEVNNNKSEKNSSISLNSNTFLDQSQLSILIEYYHVFGENLSDQEAKEAALEQLIQEAAVVEEAQNQDLKPLDEEVKTRVEEERVKFESADVKKDTQNADVKLIMDSIIKGTGMSKDEYWNSYVPKGYLFIMSQENLFNKVTNDIESLEEKNAYWQQYHMELTTKFKENYKDEIEKLITIE